MPTIEHVSIEDVFPYVDEYGNEFLSRDYTTKENQAYVERLADSMRAKGVPDEPVTLSRDGGIYRIVAGNSRVQAMRLLGTKAFDAVVLDDLKAEAAVRRAVEATVRTDTKKTYEGVEKSRFVQQLAAFRDDEYVAEAAGIDAEKVRRVRRARTIMGDDGEEMTIERMCAIAEFEGDEAAVSRLSTCKERDIDRVAKDLRFKAERAAKMREIADALTAAGIVVMEERPDGAIYVDTAEAPEDVAKAADGSPIAPTLAVASYGSYCLYRMPNGDDRENEAARAREREEREKQKTKDRANAERFGARRDEWLQGKLQNFQALRLPFLQDAALDAVSDEGGREWVLDHDIHPTAGPVEIAAFVTQLDKSEYQYGPYWYGWGGEGKRQLHQGRAETWRGVYEAMVADGYEMSKDESDVFDDVCSAQDEEE